MPISNFTGLVLGWIESEFCTQILVGKLSPRSTQCTPFYSSPISTCVYFEVAEDSLGVPVTRSCELTQMFLLLIKCYRHYAKFLRSFGGLVPEYAECSLKNEYTDNTAGNFQTSIFRTGTRNTGTHLSKKKRYAFRTYPLYLDGISVQRYGHHPYR